MTKRSTNKRAREIYNKSINKRRKKQETKKKTFCSVGLSRWLRTGACGMAGFLFLAGGSGSTGKSEHNSSSVDMFRWWIPFLFNTCLVCLYVCVRVQGRPENNWRVRCCADHWQCSGERKRTKNVRIQGKGRNPKLATKRWRERETNKTFEGRQKTRSISFRFFVFSLRRNIIVFRL